MPVQTFSTSELPSGATNWQVARRLVGAFAPHAQAMPDMSVQLDAGHLLNGTVLTEVLSQTVGPFALPLGRRVDRIVIDRSTGAASVVTGAEGSPLPPAIPAGMFPVARVRLSADMTAVTNERIDDERALSDLATAAALTPASEAEAGIAELATQAEVDAGTDDARIVTPLKAAARYATKAAASETSAGLVELATAAEVQAGTDAVRAVTPAGLKGVTDTLLRKAGDSLGGDLDAAGHSLYGEALRSAAKTVDGSGSPHVVTVDFRTGDGAAHTATANTRLTPQFHTGGGIGYLDLSNGGAFTVTFATGAKFVGGTAPSFTASGLDRVWFLGTTGSYTVAVQKGIA